MDGVEAMVRALDVQQTILQSNAVERVQQIQQQHPDIQQRYFRDQLNKEKSLLRKKVKYLEKSEQLIVKEKEEQHKRKKESKHNKQKSDGEVISDFSNDLSADEIGRKVDIRI